MEYKKLIMLFHEDNDQWRRLYELLYNFPLTKHYNSIIIKQANAQRGFPAFFYYTEEIANLLSMFTTQVIKLKEITNSLPQIAVNQFKLSCVIEEIKSSNDIEGVRSTKREINEAIDEQHDQKNSRNIRLWGIVNKYIKLQNLEHINFDTSQDLRNFYNDFILDEVCRDDPQNKPDGRIFRKSAVEVWSRTRIIHMGLEPESKIVAYMDEALSILHDETIPGLVRLAIFHYLFGYIHPFYDGNGRTSRFITSYYLAEMLDPLAALRLSITIKKSIRTYYKLFEETNSFGNCGDLTPFITGFLWLILKSITRVTELLENKANMLKSMEQSLKVLDLPDKTDRNLCYILLQAALFSDEGAKIQEIAKTANISERTVRTHLEKLPSNLVIINRDNKAHRFKLNLDDLKK